MGVKYNHTKFEQETQRWLARNGIRKWRTLVVKNCSLGLKNSHFLGLKKP